MYAIAVSPAARKVSAVTHALPRVARSSQDEVSAAWGVRGATWGGAIEGVDVLLGWLLRRGTLLGTGLGSRRGGRGGEGAVGG